MKVVFLEDVEGTAEIGDVKDVKNGFARNFLLPRGLAAAATNENVYRAGSLAAKESKRQDALDEEWRPIADKVKDYTVTLEARLGETGRLFGSITNRDIAEQVNLHLDQPIDSRTVLLAEPIRELGSFPVTVRFTRRISEEVTVNVVADEASQEIVARLEAERAETEERERREAEAAEYRAREEARARGEFIPEDGAADATDDGEAESPDEDSAEPEAVEAETGSEDETE